MSLKLVPWCEVFVDEDAVLDRASFIKVFEPAPVTIYRVSIALAAEANNGGSRLCLAVDWAPESVASFQVITCDWRSYVHFVVSPPGFHHVYLRLSPGCGDLAVSSTAASSPLLPREFLLCFLNAQFCRFCRIIVQ